MPANALPAGLAATLLLATACAGELDFAAQDAATCRAYGEPPSPAYSSCRRAVARDRELGTLLQSPVVRLPALPFPLGGFDARN